MSFNLMVNWVNFLPSSNTNKKRKINRVSETRVLSPEKYIGEGRGIRLDQVDHDLGNTRDFPAPATSIEAGLPLKLVETCHKQLTSLRLDSDGTLVIGTSDIPPELAEALTTHAEAIAQLIIAQRASLATANEYIDAEFPCDYAVVDENVEISAACFNGRHSDEEIIARWHAITDEEVF